MAQDKLTAYSGVKSNQKVRLIAKDPSIFMGTPSLLDPIKNTSGVVFPYTPTLQVSHDANYGSFETVHSNYQTLFYTNTSNPTINVTATFTASDAAEALHTAGALHFFRTCTKMDFGEENRGATGTAGTPPPVLLLSAYGILHAERIPVVIRNFSYTMPEDVDYVSFDYGPDNTTMSLPASILVSLTLGVQYTPSRQREFNINDFRTGAGIGGTEGKKAGFL